MKENEKKKFDSEKTKQQDLQDDFIKRASREFLPRKRIDDESEKERVFERAVSTGRPPKGKGDK